MISIKQGISSSNILSAAAFAAISIVALLVSFMTASYRVTCITTCERTLKA